MKHRGGIYSITSTQSIVFKNNIEFIVLLYEILLFYLTFQYFTLHFTMCISTVNSINLQKNVWD